MIREGAENRTMHVNHLVLASGFSGEARMPTFDTSEFQGTLCHSSRHKGGMGWEGKVSSASCIPASSAHR